MSVSTNSYIDLLNNISVSVYRYGCAAIYIVGNFGNLLSTLIFFKRSWSKNVCVLYFKVCLLLSSVYLSSTVLGTSLITGFNINVLNSNVLLCKLFYYVSFVTFMLFPTVLVLASVDRLLISSQNVDTRLYSSKRLAYFSVSVSAIFWFVFNSHALIKVSLQEIYPSTFICYYDLSQQYIDFVSYSLLTFNCLFCLLMIFLSILSLKNVRRIRSIPREKRDRVRSMTKKDFQLLRCLFFLVIIYIVVSVVQSTYSVYAAVRKKQILTTLERAIDSFLTNFLNVLYFTFHSTNFFVFLLVLKAFRHELKRMIYKLFGQHLLPLREEDNRPTNNPADDIEINVVHSR